MKSSGTEVKVCSGRDGQGVAGGMRREGSGLIKDRIYRVLYTLVLYNFHI